MRFEDFEYDFGVSTKISTISELLPQKRIFGKVQMKSLRNICLDNVCKNITFWLEYLPDNANKYLYVISPFDILSSIDTIGLMKRLVKLKLFNQTHFNLLFHQNLTEMELSRATCSHITTEYLKIMFNRCKKIKRLTIKNVSIPNNLIAEIPTRYPNMEHFDCLLPVSQKFVDMLLQRRQHRESTNSQQAPEKQHNSQSRYSLNINAVNGKCKSNSLDYLKSLHIDASEVNMQTLLKAIPLSITSLTIRNCNRATHKRESRKGAPDKEFHCLLDALSNMPKLTRLSLHGSQFPSAVEYSKEFPAFLQIKALDLSGTNGFSEDLPRFDRPRSERNRYLALMINACPNVVDLNLSSSTLTQDVFKSVEGLKQLVSLRIGYPESTIQKHNLEFDEHVEHCLMVVGEGLEVLDLSEFQMIHLPTIARLCPVLTELYMNGCTFEIRNGEDEADYINSIENVQECTRLNNLEVESTEVMARGHPLDRSEDDPDLKHIYLQRYFLGPSRDRLKALKIGDCKEEFWQALFCKENQTNCSSDKTGNSLALSGLTTLIVDGHLSFTKMCVVHALLACPQLTHFSLAHTDLTTQELQWLIKLKKESGIVTEFLLSREQLKDLASEKYNLINYKGGRCPVY